MASAERTEVVDLSLHDIYQVVVDYESYPQFVTGVKSAKVGQDGQNKTILFDMEMIKRLQYSVKVLENLDEKAGTAHIHWTLLKSDFFKKNNGGWKLKSLGPNKTEVTYHLDVEFSFMVPGFILKGLIANAMPSAIREFTERAQNKAKA